MKKYTCNFCNNTFAFEKFQSFAAHKSNCRRNPNFLENLAKRRKRTRQFIIHNFNCKKCGKESTTRITKRNFDKGKYKVYCSKSCASSRVQSEETKRKISKKLKKNFTPIKPCLKCGKETINSKFCSKHCARSSKKLSQETKNKISNSNKGKTGGWRNFGGNGKSGIYSGIVYQSSWELAWIIFHFDKNIPFIRNEKAFEYELDGKTRKFYPDFFLTNENKFVEIKGFWSKSVQAKIDCVKEKLDVLYYDGVKVYLDYVIEKYGRSFCENLEGIV